MTNRPYSCIQCGGQAVAIRKPYAVERGGKLLVVRDVPMLECDDCAEAYMSTETMRQLDLVLAAVAATPADEAIVRFPVAA